MKASLLQRLEQHLANTRPDHFAQLLPGVSDITLNKFETQFTLKLPEDFRQLYRWRNGQPASCNENFQQNYMFSTLESIADTKAILDGMIGQDFEDPQWWRLGWVPFLSNGSGDYLCLDVIAEDGGTPGQLIKYYHDWERRKIEFPNIESWLVSLLSPSA